MCLEKASQIASVISPFISLAAIGLVLQLYKSQKKIDLEIEVRCDFSAWVGSLTRSIDQDLLYSSLREDLLWELDGIQTKAYLCGQWAKEIQLIIEGYNNWYLAVMKSKTPDGQNGYGDEVKMRTVFFENAFALRSRLREQAKAEYFT